MRRARPKKSVTKLSEIYEQTGIPATTSNKVGFDYVGLHKMFSRPDSIQRQKNYITAMNFFAVLSYRNSNLLSDRIVRVIEEFPSFDMSPHLTPNSAFVYSRVFSIMDSMLAGKYIGPTYIVRDKLSVFGHMILNSSMNVQTVRSISADYSSQFISDEFMQEELSNDWKFKSSTISEFSVNYDTHQFTCELPDGTTNKPFTETPFTIVNTALSHMAHPTEWYKKIPAGKTVMLVGESGKKIPSSFHSLSNFSDKFPMTKTVKECEEEFDGKRFYFKLGQK